MFEVLISLILIHCSFHCYKFNFTSIETFMHQSIPAVPLPPPPRATAGHLLKLSVLGVGHSQFYCGPGLGISLPRGDPQAFDTRVFELTWKCLSEKTRPSLKTDLSVTDSKNLWMFFKVCFLNLRYFFIYTCKHMNI